MKQHMSKFFGYLILTGVYFVALFASDALHLAPVLDLPAYVTSIGDVLSNFLVIVTILMVFVGVVFTLMALIFAMFWDEMYPSMKEKDQLDKLKLILPFKPVEFTISAFAWVLLIAGGYIFTAICFMFASGAMHMWRATMKKKVEESEQKELEEATEA